MCKTLVSLVLMGLVATNSIRNSCVNGTDFKCNSCDYESKGCSECDGSYVDRKLGNCQQPFFFVANCTSYATPNKCGKCIAGYHPDKHGLCKVYTSSIAGCSLEVGGSCVYCEDSAFYPDSNGKCGTLRCEIPNCAACDSTGQCGDCGEDFTAFNGECVGQELTEVFANCRTATSTNECDACSTGYYVQEGVCVSRNGTSTLSALMAETPTAFGDISSPLLT